MSRPASSWTELHGRVVAKRQEADARKNRLNAIYRRIIPEQAYLPAEPQKRRFHVRVKEKETLLRRIFDAGLFASGHYFPTAVLFGGHRCPRAMGLYEEIVNLNNDFYVTEQQVERVASIVCDHVEGTEAQQGSRR